MFLCSVSDSNTSMVWILNLNLQSRNIAFSGFLCEMLQIYVYYMINPHCRNKPFTALNNQKSSLKRVRFPCI